MGTSCAEGTPCQGILPSTLCPPHAHRGGWNPLSAGYMPWWLSLGQASQARSATLPQLCQDAGASWGPSGPFPTSCQRPPDSQQAPVGQAKLTAAPPQNASKKPAASQPHYSCTSQILDTLPAFHWLQENTQTSTKPHQQEANLCKQSKKINKC